MPERTLLVLVAAACSAACTITDDSFTVDDAIATFRLDTPEGHVDVVGDEGSETVVDMKLWGGSTKVDWNVDGDVLDVQTDCRPGRVCAVDYDVTLPRDVFLDLNTDDGDIHVTDTSAGALLSTGSGSVHVTDLAGDSLEVDIGTGSFDGDGLRVVETTAATGTGSVDLHYLEAPRRVEVDAGVGDIDLRLPAGEYDIVADAGVGHVHLDDVEDEPGSPNVLRLDTGVGDITISGY